MLWQVTSVSFSACATYFQASCTGNCTFIWDTRMMPLESGCKCVEHPPPLAQEKSFRALHHLSHGDPMPTSDNSFQVPGYVELNIVDMNVVSYIFLWSSLMMKNIKLVDECLF